MQPLAFLFVRSFVNGFRRAVTSPRRLISLIVFIVYYFFIVIRPFTPNPDSQRFATPLPYQFRAPDPASVDAVVFALMTLISAMMLSGILNFKGGFKPADVDVLFPTPVSPRIVLVFRIVRDYLLTLIAPLFFGLIGWRGTSVGLRALFHNFPHAGGDVLRATWIGWMLMALTWVLVGYAASMFVNRSDLQSDRNRTFIGIGIAVALVSVAVIAGFTLRASPSLETAAELTRLPLFRLMFLPSTAATAIVTGTYEGNWTRALLGASGLIAIGAVALRVALSQVSYMYDQAAARGFDSLTLRKLQRSGDQFAMVAQRARAGKVRQGRLTRWIAGHDMRRGGALLWKELILQIRGSGASGLLTLSVFGVAVMGMVTWLFRPQHQPEAAGGIILAVQGFTVFAIATSTAQSGFIELLRRVDLQKPLPINPTSIVFWEVAGKAIFPTICGILSAIVAMTGLPDAWPFAVASAVLVPAFALVIIATVFLSVVLFPDLDDPTQRGFRQMIMMIAIIIFCGPGAGVLAAFMYWGTNIALASIPAALVCLGVTVGVSAAAGSFYAEFNPSD